MPEQTYLVAITPFQTERAASADAALLIIENITSLERAKRLEVEASNLRLITTMAEHLAHEIGNSVVPLSTHQQLLDTGGLDDEEFRASLSQALGAGVKRITRLANQMMFLARGKTDFGDQIRVNELIDEAFREAYVYHNGKAPDFDIAGGHGKAHHRRRPQGAAPCVLRGAAQCAAGDARGEQENRRERQQHRHEWPARSKRGDSRRRSRFYRRGSQARAGAVFLNAQCGAGPGPDRDAEDHRGSQGPGGNRGPGGEGLGGGADHACRLATKIRKVKSQKLKVKSKRTSGVTNSFTMSERFILFAFGVT